MPWLYAKRIVSKTCSKRAFKRIILYFLQESETNEVKVAVNGKRRWELGLVVPGMYCGRTKSKRTVKILGDQLKIIKEKYAHFSWQYEEQEMHYKIPV